MHELAQVVVQSLQPFDEAEEPLHEFEQFVEHPPVHEESQAPVQELLQDVHVDDLAEPEHEFVQVELQLPEQFP